MVQPSLELRKAEAADLPAVMALHRICFGEQEGGAIAALIAALAHDPMASAGLSLLALEQQQLLGHVLFTPVWLAGCSDQAAAGVILAPFAVQPSRQGQGIGRRLIEASLADLRSRNVERVFVLGDPALYGRFGFMPALDQGWLAPQPIPEEHRDAWMVLSLVPSDRAPGLVRCCKALEDPQYWL
jgi:putative acetyltransferase